MSQQNVGPYILGGCIALAVGMGILASAIRDAGDRIGTGAGNAGLEVRDGLNLQSQNTASENGRYFLKADPGLASGAEAYWIFDLKARTATLYSFTINQGQIEQHKLYENSLR